MIVAAASGDGACRRRPIRVDVALTWATPDARPDGGARVGVHHGTRESAARLVELGGRFFQLRLEEPIVPAAGDRLVIRSLAPPDTLGGGVVLDPRPRRHGPSRDLLARLARLERGEPEPEAPPRQRPAPKPRARARSAREALALEQRLATPATSRRSTTDPRAPRRAARARPRVRLGPTMHVHPDALDEVHDLVVAADRARRPDHARAAARRAEDLTQVRAGLPGALRRARRSRSPGRGAGAAPPA